MEGVGMSILTTVVIVILLGYLLLRFNSVWVYILIDRAKKNDKSSLQLVDELPRYFKLNKKGDVDTSVPWHGWDGWYFFMVPDDKDLPLKMVRASLMTGLYGLEGIDNYEKLLLRLSTNEAVEHLTLIPTLESINGNVQKQNHLSHSYLPKKTDLIMKSDHLDVAITGSKVISDEEKETYGRIRGTWPNYELEFINPEGEIKLTLKYDGENIIWWADIPGLFAYFAAFGKFDGKIIYKRGTVNNDTHKLMDKEEVYAIKGSGCFEHGFARKPFDFDRPWLPIRLLKNLFPRLKTIRYHYELLVGGDLRGGFMHARGFGIDFRNRGGLFQNSAYKEIKSVKIKYLNDPKPDLVNTDCSAEPAAVFYRRWEVKAETNDGILEYIGTREWPPASISTNMIYYNFSYEGTYKGQKISGRGYGEYVHI
jgi:hypothetical protein